VAVRLDRAERDDLLQPGCLEVDAEPPRTIYLEAPRPLTDHERALVEWLLESPVAPPELRAQLDVASVVGVCSCGCPSVTLGVPDETPAAELDPDHPDVRHGCDVDITADAVAPDGRAIEVILHVTLGQLQELEVWAGTWGGDPRTELPDVATLSWPALE
jgi:hypothetical protein